MTPDYRAMTVGLVDLGIAVRRAQVRLAAGWLDLARDCGARYAGEVGRRDGRNGGAPPGVVDDADAARQAARDCLRGWMSLTEVAVLDVAAELDAIRAARHER